MIKNLLDDSESDSSAAEPKTSNRGSSSVLSLFDSTDESSPVEPTGGEPASYSEGPTESAEDTVRNTGLAWSAGIAFFGAVVFMLILGWGADLLLGTAPWGIVGGIVLGSIIGFVQFFRISSQIFKK